MSESGKMYDYYAEQEILPTECHFQTPEQFHAYEIQRRDLICDKLSIPIQFFNQCEILEIGPDSGENGLVFAEWGSLLHFVEPNPKAIHALKKNFSELHSSEKISALHQKDLLSFDSDQKFDFIVAEGFLHTIRPYEAWLKKINTLLKRNGLLLISYVNSYGAIMDLLYSLLASVVKKNTHSDQEYKETLEQLFYQKWHSVSHTRSFDSWRMDVLESPYNSRLINCIDPEILIREAFDQDLLLYSSWPSYKPKDDLYWHKKLKSKNEQLELILNQIQHDQLSYFFEQQYFYHSSQKEIAEVNRLLLNLSTSIDVLKDKYEKKNIKIILKNIDALESLFSKLHIDNIEIMKKISCIKEIMRYILGNQLSELIAFCNTNEIFIKFWGLPSHYLVLRKSGE